MVLFVWHHISVATLESYGVISCWLLWLIRVRTHRFGDGCIIQPRITQNFFGTWSISSVNDKQFLNQIYGIRA